MEQSDLLAYVVDTLERLNITYMLVGSLASGTYGEPRLTQDIDIVIDVTPSQVQSLCAAFDPAQFYVSLEAALQALRTAAGQFNVIDPESGNKIDFMIARQDEWGREQIGRRSRQQLLPGKSGYVVRPEDVIIGKMLYYQEGGSEKHLRDITGILKMSGALVDRDYIERWAAHLGLAEIWQDILTRLPVVGNTKQGRVQTEPRTSRAGTPGRDPINQWVSATARETGRKTRTRETGTRETGTRSDDP